MCNQSILHHSKSKRRAADQETGLIGVELEAHNCAFSMQLTPEQVVEAKETAKFDDGDMSKALSTSGVGKSKLDAYLKAKNDLLNDCIGSGLHFAQHSNQRCITKTCGATAASKFTRVKCSTQPTAM